MPSAAARFIDNPLAGWANDDLLFAPETRAYFAAHHAAALPVFDWPELRARFADFDAVANAARRRSRRGGVQAAMVGFASLVVGALTPVLTFGAPADAMAVTVLGIATAVLAAAATLWGYFQLLTGQRKQEWLTNRFWTERLRQLHFQFILNNLTLAVALMRDPAERAEWDRRRAAALAEFEMRFVRPATAAFKRMRDDIAEQEFWVRDDWRTRPALPLPSPELDAVFALVDNQRFEIQRRFSDLKATPGLFSSATRAGTVRSLSDFLTLFILIATIAGGCLLAAGYPADGEGSLPAKLVAAALALAAAAIVLLRVLNEGLQLASEAERYRWYHAAVTALQARYGRAELAGKIELLRDMEHLSYQEMRWFLTAFHAARFVI